MRILGLDIGSFSVKGVLIDTVLGRYTIHDHQERPVLEGQSPVTVASQILQSLPKPPDKISVALRTSRVTSRVKTFPKKDRKAIQASIAFDLEDDLPFPPDSYIYDYAIAQSVGNLTQVYACAAMKNVISDHIALLQEHGIDADYIFPEAVAYRALFRKLFQTEAIPDPAMLVQLGHEKSIIYIQSDQVPIVSREIPFGGRDLNLALSQYYKIPIAEAERTKLESGFVLPLSQMENISDQQREFTEVVYEAIVPMLKEIRQADLACKNQTHNRAERIFLVGGTAQLPGISAVIAEDAKIPTFNLRSLTLLDKGGVTYSESTDYKFTLAAGLALACLNSERSFAIHFRKREFSKTSQETKIQIDKFKKPIQIYIVTCLLAITLLYTQSWLYAERLSDSQVKLERGIKNFFSGISQSTLRSYLANTGNLKKTVESELNKERQLVELLKPNPYSPFEYLKELSAAVPKDIVTDMLKYQVGSSATVAFSSVSPGDAPIEMEFLVANPQVAEKLSQLLSRKISEFKRTELSEVKGKDQLKKYKITFSGKMGGVSNRGN